MENINIEENTCSCANCKETFNLSFIYSSEEAEQINNFFANPPKNIKITKKTEQTTVKFYLNASGFLFVLPILFGMVTLLSYVALSGTQIFRKENDFGNLLFSSIWTVFLLCSAGLLYNAFYSVFGRIELASGQENCIFRGFWVIGRETNIDWEKIEDFYSYYLLDDGEVGKTRSDYIYIKEKKITKIPIEHLEEKTKHILNTIKYFRYKAMFKNSASKYIM